MTSTTNTAGLEVVAWRWHVRGELHWVFCDKKPNFAVSQPGNVCGLEPLVTAASAQARIAELVERAEKAEREADLIGSACDKIRINMSAEIHQHMRRATAAEARADRLEKALEEMRDEIESQRDAITHPQGRRAHFIDSTDQIRVDQLTALLDSAALQQEG